MLAVVNIVRVDDTLKIFASFFRPPPDALMHQDVVEDQVEQPVTENPRGHGQQVGVVHHLRGVEEQADTRQAEDKRKQIIAFQGHVRARCGETCASATKIRASHIYG